MNAVLKYWEDYAVPHINVWPHLRGAKLLACLRPVCRTVKFPNESRGMYLPFTGESTNRQMRHTCQKIGFRMARKMTNCEEQRIVRLSL